MSILKIKNDKGDWVGVTSVKGEKGDPGVSPDITVAKNDRKTYQLKINTKDRMFTTPNLRPNESAYIGNTDGELGMIDNWYDPEGHRVTPYLSELPQLPRLGANYKTRYIFDHDVVMYTMDGEPNEKGICSIEDYTKHEGSEIIVDANGQEFLTDYIIYNARPKYEWDTWEEKQLMKKTTGFPDMLVNWDEYKNKYDQPCPYQPGNWNWVDAYMVATKDLVSVCDEPLRTWGHPDQQGNYGAPQEMTDPKESPLSNIISESPDMKCAIWQNLDNKVEGNCCGDDEEDWGITKAFYHINREKEQRELFPEEFGMTVFSESTIGKMEDAEGNNVIKDLDLHRGIFVALSPSKNYTIESLNGAVGIFAPSAGITLYGGEEACYGKHVTKVKKDLYGNKVQKIIVNNRERYNSQDFNDYNKEIGKSPVHSDKIYGNMVTYFVETEPQLVARAEVPAIYNVPHKVIQKGESVTIRIGNTIQPFLPNLWGVYLFCWNEEDYQGIKITEGIEPYSVLNAERLAAGATKFNLKVCFGTAEDDLGDVNDIRYEYNIKLVDTTEDMGYVRYLTNEMKKSYDLDEFSLVGHTHSIDDLIDVDDLKVPKMKLSTMTLTDGISKLEENTFYFVYEGE